MEMCGYEENQHTHMKSRY